jgi:hypothetical protein
MLSSGIQRAKAAAGSANFVKGQVSSTMTKSQKPSVRVGRSELAVILVLSVELLSVASPVLGLSRKDKFWEKADVSGVVKAVRRHRGGLPSELECEQLIRLNFKHLYFNALQTDRFIAMPKPDKVLERMSKVFSLAAELKSLLDEARLLSEAGGEMSELRGSTKKIRDCAAGIHDTFHGFFKEDTNGSFRVELPPNVGERARFAEYLVHCEQISSLLNQELERYFLNPAPGIVEVSTFRSCSIPVLSLCLQRLSLNFEKSVLE